MMLMIELWKGLGEGKYVGEDEYMKWRLRDWKAEVEGVGNNGEKTRMNIKEEEQKSERRIRETEY